MNNSWVRFLRNYGPIPNNDNMYDESIQRVLEKRKIVAPKLPAPVLDDLLNNFRSSDPRTEILTGTAGDGKTYHCREVWLGLGGTAAAWNAGEKIQKLKCGSYELVIVKDLSELRVEESLPLLTTMASDVVNDKSPRLYLIAANHGQLLEKLRIAARAPEVSRLHDAVEELLVSGRSSSPAFRLNLRDLSRTSATKIVDQVIDAIALHPGWGPCSDCALQKAEQACPIWENRRRLLGEADQGLMRRRLSAIVEISEQNGVHFPIRQLLELVSNALLGHPAAPDGLMSCADVPAIVENRTRDKASVYRNLFGLNLKTARAEKTEVFRKLNSFGIGVETSSLIDNLLVFGADDPALKALNQELVIDDPIYGGNEAFTIAQRDYLEGTNDTGRADFEELLRAQRQRLFFTLPSHHEDRLSLWDLTIFRYAGLYLKSLEDLRNKRAIDRRVTPLIIRGLNRVFTAMLVQNSDELVLATSGGLSYSRSPLLDEIISVPRKGGEEVSFGVGIANGIVLRIHLSRDEKPIELPLTPTRFEFLCRVADGALASSFSLECQEDLLAFKAKLLAGTERRRAKFQEEDQRTYETVLNFIDLAPDGRAFPKRVVVRA